MNLYGRCCRQFTQLRLSHTKTPVQQFGHEYLKQQISLKRPLSPHLTIYRPQLTSTLSISSRICGVAMAGALFVGGLGFAVLPYNFTDFANGVRALNLPHFVTGTAKFLVAFPMAFYALNEIRMLGFELAKGIDLPSIYRSGWLVVGLSVALALLVVLNSKRQPAPATKKSKY